MLTNMFYAEDYKEERDLTGNAVPIAIGPGNMFVAESFPTNYTFSLIILISDFNYSFDDKLRIVFKELKTGKILQELKDLTIPVAAGETQNINFNLGFRNFNIPSEGIYIAELFVNEEKVHEAKVLFKKMKRG